MSSDADPADQRREPIRPRRIRALIDHIVASGPLMVAAGLVAVLVLLALVGATIRWIAGGDTGIVEQIWDSFVRLFDSGSHAEDLTTPDRIVGVALVLVGIVGSAVLLAIVVTAFQDVVERVRNGRSPLIRQPDTVILGWSHEIFTLIGELNASPIAHPDIAVLSGHQRVWMDDALRRAFGRRRGGYSIACRTGDRTDPGDLDAVRVTGADRVLVLADRDAPDQGDLIKTVFALVNHGVDLERQRVIVEVSDIHHAQIVTSVFGGAIEVVAAHDVLTHILTQSMRAKGFGQIFDKLTSYQHADFYEHRLPGGLEGHAFGELLVRARGAIPVGVTRAGRGLLLPAMDTVLEPGDRVLVLAEDNTEPTIAAADPDRIPHQARPAPIEWSDQDLLVIGWNPFVDPALEELRGFLADGSRIDVIADASAMSDGERRDLEGSQHLDRVWLAETAMDTLGTIRSRLAARTYDAVAVVPYRDIQDAGQADSRSLVYLAVVQDTVDEATTRVVGELRQSRTEQLTGHIAPDDVILSDALAASVMAQLTDRPWLTGALRDLFDFHGSALFAHHGRRWGYATAEPFRFGDLIVAAARHNEIPVGFRNGDRVELAPDQDAVVTLGPDDAVYVLGPALGWTGRPEPPARGDPG